MDSRVLSTTRIPYDILISIIDELALRNQFKDLSACSQTCRMLLHPCRLHLFSTVTIARNAPQFAAVLDRNPTIQVYIQELTYDPIASAISKDVANALLLLSNLKTLVLRGYAYAYLNWKAVTLTPYIQHALAHLFSSPSITRIVIHGPINVPITLLSSCSNLKYLEIDHDASCATEGYNTTLLAPPKLVSLNVAKAGMVTVEFLFNGRRPDGLPWLDLSDLRSLTIRVVYGSVVERHLAQILRPTFSDNERVSYSLYGCRGPFSTPKLEHLCYTVPDNTPIPDSLFQTLTFSTPTLRSFKMEWHIDDNEVSEKFPGLIKALQVSACHPNNINEFSLILRTAWTHTLATQDWEMIDQLLANRSAFRRLEKLSIKFWTRLGVSEKAEEKRMQDQLAEFRVTQLLQLSSASGDYLDFQFTFDDDEPRWISVNMN